MKPVEVSVVVEGAARLSGICGGEVIGDVITGTDEGESGTGWWSRMLSRSGFF